MTSLLVALVSPSESRTIEEGAHPGRRQWFFRCYCCPEPSDGAQGKSSRNPNMKLTLLVCLAQVEWCQCPCAPLLCHAFHCSASGPLVAVKGLSRLWKGWQRVLRLGLRGRWNWGSLRSSESVRVVSRKGGKELSWQGVVSGRRDEGEVSQVWAAFSAYMLCTDFSFSSSSSSSLLFSFLGQPSC